MRSVAPIRALFGGLLLAFGLFAVAGCSAPPPPVDKEAFAEANPIMADEIDRRVAEIPFQHREELYENMLWLSGRGEVAIPALLSGLQHEEPKTRSSCAWVLGQIRDRRTIPALQHIAADENPGVRFEVARALVNLGDLSGVGALIEGLDSDKVQVRYYCHESLKKATGRDFGYDHLADDMLARSQTVYQWRVWWSGQTQDPFFASNYAEQHGIDTGESVEIGTGVEGQPAAPAGETVPEWLQPGSAAPQPAGSQGAAPVDPAAPQDGAVPASGGDTGAPAGNAGSQSTAGPAVGGSTAG